MDIEVQVHEIIKQFLGAQDITNDSLFVDDLGADDLDLTEIMMAFEEKFDIEIPDEEADRIKTG
ncbi:acyl carrier protein [Aspergillus spectabilis]